VQELQKETEKAKKKAEISSTNTAFFFPLSLFSFFVLRNPREKKKETRALMFDARTNCKRFVFKKKLNNLDKGGDGQRTHELKTKCNG
jgi:hypothetical protein